MKRLVIKEPQDVALILNRRKWWVLVTFLVLGVIAALVAVLLPSIYVSETLVLIEPKEVPDDVVRDFVTSDTEERLSAIQQTALSRTNLLRILGEFPDGFDELRSLNEARQIELLRKRIIIEVTTGRRGRDTVVPYFKISYQDRDAGLAQKVTERLATFFIEQDARTREAQVFGTTDFLQSELQKVEQELKEVEDTLSNLKERYRYELPEQLDTNLRTMDRLQEEMKANNEARDRYLSLKLDLERRLSETPPVFTREEMRRTAGGSVRQVSPLVAQYRQKEMQLSELTSRYTDRHPDVVRLQSELERLREQIPPEDLEEVTAELEGEGLEKNVFSEPNPAYQQLTSQLSQVNTELKILDERRQRTEQEINLYSRRIENTPQREQELANSQRRYEALQARHADLESKLTEAQLASSLESRQKGEQFQVVDPASLPLTPAKPNRLLVLLAGLSIALAGGLGLAAAVEFVDQKVWNVHEVTELLNLPVIGEIPQILLPRELERKRRKAWIQAAAFGSLSVIAAVTVVLVYSTPSIRSAGTENLARLLGW